MTFHSRTLTGVNKNTNDGSVPLSIHLNIIALTSGDLNTIKLHSSLIAFAVSVVLLTCHVNVCCEKIFCVTNFMLIPPYSFFYSGNDSISVGKDYIQYYRTKIQPLMLTPFWHLQNDKSPMVPEYAAEKKEDVWCCFPYDKGYEQYFKPQEMPC